MRSGLKLRAVLASALLAALVAGAFAVLLVAVVDLRASARTQALAATQLDAAARLKLLVTQMQLGLRGAVITRGKDPRSIEEWTAAKTAFPAQMASLMRREVDRRQAARLETIRRDVTMYGRTGLKTIRRLKAGTLPPSRPATAVRRQTLIGPIGEQLDAYRSAQLALRDRLVRRNDALTRRAVISAIAGLVGSLLLVLLFYGYISRVLVSPVRRVAQAASRLAGGDLAFRVAETGSAETLVLEQSFNSMAVALERRRDELSSLADEQSALRRVATLVASGIPPAELFDAVVRETLAVMDATSAQVCRYESDGTATVLADCSRVGDPVAAGTRLPLDGESVTASVWNTQRASRSDDLGQAPETTATPARGSGQRSAVAAPIVVNGQLWGVVSAGWKRDQPPAADSEERLTRFAELLGVAVANAEGRDQLIASRVRLLTEADQARRRVVRDLHDGAQQRLVHTVLTLKLAEQALQDQDESAEVLVAEALAQAEQGTAELRELAHGILPGILTRGGLSAGVNSVVSRLDLPVEVNIPDDRFPPEIEASAYFIAAEALTNVVKHAQARHAEIGVCVEDGMLHLEIRDDGVGGADTGGHGIVGLVDRAAALGGRLRLESPSGGGTVLTADLPLAR